MQKKFIKVLLVFVLLFMIMFSFVGCTQVNAMTITNQDGTIDEIVNVSLNSNEILSAGYSIVEMKADIQSTALNEANKFVLALNKKISDDLLLVSDEESISTLNYYKNGIEVIQSTWTNNTMQVGIRFKNIDVYKYFYNVGNVNVEMQEEKHFFYTKAYYYGNTMYLKHNGLYNSMNILFSLTYPEFIDSSDNKLYYTYTTDLRREHSDAEKISYKDGLYYHTWEVDPENANQNIMIYYNVANRANCIIVSLGITLVSVLILFGISLIIKTTKKSRLN